jgi:uncharacterized membrane protein YhaH (DUF805 family)
MGFGQALVSGFKNYVNFSERAPRSAYWYWVLWMIILGFGAGLIDVVLGSDDSGYGVGPVGMIVTLATFLPGLALCIRRLHDVDRSGWWFLIALTIFGCIFLIYWACTKGTTGPNRFGPDPLGGALNQPAAA